MDFFLAKQRPQMTLQKMKERLSLLKGVLDICFDEVSGWLVGRR